MNRDICSRAAELGRKYQEECGGCAQSTVAAVFDALGEECSDEVFRAATGLAGGLGLTTDCTCGALVGGVVAISCFFGRRRDEFKDKMASMPSCLLAKQLHDMFADRHGSVHCHELQQKIFGRTYKLFDPRELEEAMKDEAMKRCGAVVGATAGMAMEIILQAK